MRKPAIQLVALLAAIALLTLADVYPAGAEDGADARRAGLLADMRSLAEQTDVRYQGDAAPPKLADKPVFRYDDQPRRILDATLWVWTDGGRPVAFEKIEATDRGSPRWSHCFTSFSTELLTVDWPLKHRLEASQPGLSFRPVPGAPAVAAKSAERRRQMRELARQFSARIIAEDKNSTQMRLLTTPICEFADPKTEILLGAVFGFGTNGTNPDMLLALEVRSDNDTPKWHFAPARITTNAIRLHHQEKLVWEMDQVDFRKAPFTNWTCFGIPRTTPNPDGGSAGASPSRTPNREP